jgi:hypothetical protein
MSRIYSETLKQYIDVFNTTDLPNLREDATELLTLIKGKVYTSIPHLSNTICGWAKYRLIENHLEPIYNEDDVDTSQKTLNEFLEALEKAILGYLDRLYMEPVTEPLTTSWAFTITVSEALADDGFKMTASLLKELIRDHTAAGFWESDHVKVEEK